MTGILDRIANRSALAGITGQGYVGLPFALVLEEAGFRVRGLAVDPVKVAASTRGDACIRHSGDGRVRGAAAHAQFHDPALCRGVELVVDTRHIVQASAEGPRVVVRA